MIPGLDAGFAFDDAGQRVRITLPACPGDAEDLDGDPATETSPRPAAETLRAFVEFITTGTPDPYHLGMRLILVAFLLQVPGGPTTQRQLAATLGISEVALSLRLTRLRHRLRTGKSFQRPTKSKR